MSEALGMIECRSFPAMVEAADAMVKAAKVEGRTAGARIGDVVAVHVIARPHSGVDATIPLGREPGTAKK
jgi:microcompartment protein CcmL/EutN